jgi:tRNA A-37 threonylcarbamoyl transferase component Bud32
MEPIPFGKYLLVDRIAQGGMAEVYRALLRGPDGFEKTFAIKRILPAFTGIDDFVKRFTSEARLVDGLTHVNIAQVFDFGEIDGSYYLAMEFVEGVDLGRLYQAALRMGEPLGLPFAVFIVAEAARGLAYAHARSEGGRPLGIVHRDVSPQNILVSYAGEVKIADFGIAKATGAMHLMAHQTSSGAMMGKLRYMSPEQVAGEPLDGRSDIFSLGVVLNESLTGKVLIDADSPGGCVDMIKRADFPPPSTKNPAVPPDLDRIVAKALARDRAARYERAADLARDLTLFLNERAPGFAREDLGAFVERVAPRRRDVEDRPDVGEPPSPLAATAVDKRKTPGKKGAALAPEAVPVPVPGAAPVPVPVPGGVAVAAAAETRISPPPGTRRRTAAIATATLLVGALGGGAFIRFRSHPGPPQTRIIYVQADGGAVVPVAVPVLADAGAPPDATPALAEGPDRDARRARLLAALRATPRESVTRRGVLSSPEYRALLSAVDAALCATPPGRDDPVFPATAQEPLHRLAIADEATALARYLLATGALPPEVASAFQSAVANRPGYAPGAVESGGYGVAALASLAEPSSARFALDLVRQQGALGRWRDPPSPGAPAGRHPELCERQPALARLARAAPDAKLTRALLRFAKALPPGAPADDGGLRFAVTGAERNREAEELVVVVRVDNRAAAATPLPLRALRLADLDRAPALDPDLDSLPANTWREIRLSFTGVGDELADAAVLLLRPGVELAAYSEAQR